MKTILLFIFIALIGLSSCSKNTAGSSKGVKPKYHHSWYKDHVYKKKWHIGRKQFEFEKQGVKKVK